MLPVELCALVIHQAVERDLNAPAAVLIVVGSQREVPILGRRFHSQHEFCVSGDPHDVQPLLARSGASQRMALVVAFHQRQAADSVQEDHIGLQNAGVVIHVVLEQFQAFQRTNLL